MIRTGSDRGSVVILDPRMLTKPYGRIFLDSLPPARVVIEQGARAVYAKSGHWPTTDANDVIVFRDTTFVLPAPRLDASDVHGTGCTLASLWAGRLAFAGDASQGSIADAARWAKGFLFRALESAIVVGDGQRVVRLERD